MALIDTSSAFGQRAQLRLADEQVIWLTTQDPDGTPQPSPAWFLLEEGHEILIYSQRNKPKVRNIEARPVVALTFNATPSGGDVVIFHGEARVDPSAPAAVDHPAYLERYASSIAGLGFSNQQFSDEYAVPIRVKHTQLRGF